MYEFVASSVATIISLAALAFSVFSWRESHRPVVTARLSSALSGNAATVFELIVENTGNRPAFDVRLQAKEGDLEKVFAVQKGDPVRKSCERVFDIENFIPVLEAERSVKNSFGVMSEKETTWVHKAILEVEVSYFDMNQRKFRSKMKLRFANNRGFAGGYYEKPPA